MNKIDSRQVTNIGPKQRKTRRFLGYIFAVISVIVGILYVISGWSFWALIVFFVLVQTSVLLILEAKHGVCPLNAVRGKQSMTGYFSIGQEDFRDKELLPEVKSIALEDFIKASGYALGASLTVYLIALIL